MHPRGRRPSSTSRAEPGPAAPPTATPASTPAAGRLFLLPSPSFPTPCLVLPFRLLAGPPPVGWSRRAGLVGRGPGDAGRGKQRRGGGCGGVLSPSPTQRGPRRASLGPPASRGPGLFPGARAAWTCARAPRTRGSACNVFGHVCVSGLSPASASSPAPEQRERGWGATSVGCRLTAAGWRGLRVFREAPGRGGREGFPWQFGRTELGGTEGRREVRSAGGEWAAAAASVSPYAERG